MKHTLGEMRAKLEGMLEKKRLEHSLSTAQCAKEIALRFGADAQRAEIAGLLHDCAKGMEIQEYFAQCARMGYEPDETERISPKLLHARVGAHMAKTRFGVDDEEILRAILLHTTGDGNMQPLDKVVYLADMIEPMRKPFAQLEEIREIAQADLDAACLMTVEECIKHVLLKGQPLHPAAVAARNNLLSICKSKE